MNVTVVPNCACSHAAWRHIAESGHCRRPGCGCTAYRRPPAPWPSDEEAAVLHRFENTRPAPESYRPDDEPAVSGKATIPDHLRTDTVHDYRRQKGEL